jgi:N-acyl-D-amino-acid deacylase
MKRWITLAAAVIALSACNSMQGERSRGTSETAAPAQAQAKPNLYDVLVRGGTLYDGSGQPGQALDVAIQGERVVALLPRPNQAEGKTTVDAIGMAVAPGFINMLSWADTALIADGRSMSDIKQGVTLEVFGEGWSNGPLNEQMKKETVEQQGDIKYDVTWTTLGEYLDQLIKRGITPNVASMVGATTVRIHELQYQNRHATADELKRMQELVRGAMREGALGVGSSLIYAPASYSDTPELVALTQAAAEFGGGYVSHMRSEADRLPQALEELIEIGRAAHTHAEAYHFKAAGERNWPKMAQAIARIERARAEGLSISANMYTYTAGATGLDAAMPTWVQEGGLDKWVARLKDKATRACVIAEMRDSRHACKHPPKDHRDQPWENLMQLAGKPERVKFIGFKNEKLKPLTGKTLAEVAALRGTSPEDTAIDLVIEDHNRVDTIYFLMSEDNVELGLKQPWVALASDAESSAPEGVFLKSSTHPRAYGNVARLLGHYVRERQLMPLEEGVRRLTRLPAENWKLRDRGCLALSCYADVVVFDPAAIADRATYDKPQQYAVGVRDVVVNGVQVLKAGEHTGATPGQVVRGPGWCGWTPQGCKQERVHTSNFE